MSNSGSLEVYQATILSNMTSLAGAGINNDSLATTYLENSNISSNSITASDSFGGAGIFNGGTLDLSSVTIANNSSLDSGGGIENATGDVVRYCEYDHR